MITVDVDGVATAIDLANPIPIYLMPSSLTPLTCFGIQPFARKNLCSIESKNSCNCSLLSYCPHAHGTHLETSAHVFADGLSPREACRVLSPLLPSIILDADKLNGVTRLDHIKAVCIRFGTTSWALSNGCFDFTGNNPPSLSQETVLALHDKFPAMQLLLVDLPSVDPEADGGLLAAHKAFFEGASSVGIVELCLIPDALPTGQYALSLGLAYLEGTNKHRIYIPGMATIMSETCIFCKIIRGAIPCHKLMETATTLAFLDINPLSAGHALIIPKYHAAIMNQLPDENLTDILPIAKKLAEAMNLADYNILQNNGRLAHQEVDHVHFHLIPKPNASEGLGIRWPSQPTDHAKFSALAETIRSKIAN